MLRVAEWFAWVRKTAPNWTPECYRYSALWTRPEIGCIQRRWSRCRGSAWNRAADLPEPKLQRRTGSLVSFSGSEIDAGQSFVRQEGAASIPISLPDTEGSLSGR